jgi:hypothetical protein
MMPPMSPASLARIAVAVLLSPAATGCFRVPRESATLSAVKAQPELTATQLQGWVYEAGRRSSAVIEATADVIAARSYDPTVRLQAIRWKAAAIPLIEEASLRTEPVVAAIDLWGFSMQQSDYLRRGEGRDNFGSLQPLAIAAADTLERLVADVVARTRQDGPIPSEVTQSLRTWAERHPIRGAWLQRESILGSNWKALGISETSLFGTVASLHRDLVGVSNRLGYLNEGMFKRAFWQGQLAAGEALKQSGSLLDSSRKTFFHDVSEQQRQFFGAVDGQRIATLTALTAERVAVLAALRGERVATIEALRGEREIALDALREERIAMLGAIREERIATLAAVDSITQRSIDHAGAMIGRLLLWTFLGVLLLGGLVLAAVVVLRRRTVG